MIIRFTNHQNLQGLLHCCFNLSAKIEFRRKQNQINLRLQKLCLQQCFQGKTQLCVI